MPKVRAEAIGEWDAPRRSLLCGWNHSTMGEDEGTINTWLWSFGGQVSTLGQVYGSNFICYTDWKWLRSKQTNKQTRTFYISCLYALNGTAVPRRQQAHLFATYWLKIFFSLLRPTEKMAFWESVQIGRSSAQLRVCMEMHNEMNVVLCLLTQCLVSSQWSKEKLWLRSLRTTCQKSTVICLINLGPINWRSGKETATMLSKKFLDSCKEGNMTTLRGVWRCFQASWISLNDSRLLSRKWFGCGRNMKQSRIWSQV